MEIRTEAAKTTLEIIRENETTIIVDPVWCSVTYDGDLSINYEDDRALSVIAADFEQPAAYRYYNPRSGLDQRYEGYTMLGLISRDRMRGGVIVNLRKPAQA